MAEIPVEIRPRFRGGKLRRRFLERRDKGDAALECVAHGSVPFMRCSLGARGENATRGKVFAMARGTRVRGGVFSDTTGRRGDGFPADTMGRRGDGFPAAFPALEAWAVGVFVFPGAFPSVMREGGAGAEGVVRRGGGVVSTRRAGTGRCRQVASGAAAFFRVDGDRRSDRGVFPRRHAGRGSQCGGRRQAMGGVVSARRVGTGRWRGGEVFSIRFAGG